MVLVECLTPYSFRHNRLPEDKWTLSRCAR